MKVRLGRFGVLAAACVGAALAVSVPTASAAGVLPCKSSQGAGSSLQNNVQKNVWIPGFTGTPGGWEKLCNASPTITYNSTSSGKGKTQWGYEGGGLKTGETGETSFPAYIGSDLAPSKAQIENMSTAGEQASKEDVMAVPVVQSAVSVVISLPTSCIGELNKAAEVKSANLTKEWEEDNVSLETLASHVKTCAIAPKLQARSSNSGTTAAFKRYFDTLTGNVEPWKKLTETPLKAEEPIWPAALPAGQPETAGNEKGSQVVTHVMEHPGNVGYADLSDAKAVNFKEGGVVVKKEFPNSWKKIKNEAGEEYWIVVAKIQNNLQTETAAYASPEASGGASNCENAHYEEPAGKVGQGVDWSKVKQTNVAETGNTAYPICTLTYDLVWKKYETKALYEKYAQAGGTAAEKEAEAKEVANTTLGYLEWIVGAGATEGQEVGGVATEHFSKLSETIRKDAEAAVTSANIE